MNPCRALSRLDGTLWQLDPAPSGEGKGESGISRSVRSLPPVVPITLLLAFLEPSQIRLLILDLPSQVVQ